MSKLLYHEACPSCGSRDNVGVYSDGHKWCFTPCGFYVPPDGVGIQEAVEKATKQREKAYGKAIVLPDDFQYSLPSAPRNWLKVYGITDEEIVKNRIGWSEQYQGLIFPAFDIYGNLLLYQRRRWPEKDFHTEGRPELVDHVIGDNTGLRFGSCEGTICTVEDYVSTVKVARFVPTMCLWGSSLSTNRIRRLAGRYSRLIIWFDRDKTREAVKRKLYAEPFFDSVEVVSTSLDPKACSDEAIRSHVELRKEGV